MIEIKNVSKNYGAKEALKNMNLTIKPGDIFAFIGHNGAGKTTLIKSMTDIFQFDEGDILYDGISIKENPVECKKKIAYIPDSPEIYSFLKGIEYLNFVANIYQVNDNREEKIKTLADEFELTEVLNNPISSYSHGMKQKLIIISSLLHDPKYIIMDEPFVGLDPLSTRKLKDHMKKITKQGGAIFFSTHVLEVAEKICNKVAIIKNGKLIKTGDMKEILLDKSLEDIFLELENE